MRYWIIGLAPALALLAVFACGSDTSSDSDGGGGGATIPCTQGTESKILRKKGFLQDATYWACPAPKAIDSRASFAQAEGIAQLVTGGSTKLALAWQGVDELKGRNLLMGVEGERGYYWVPAPSNDLPLEVELFILPDAPGGDKTLFFAIDDGTGTPEKPRPGPYLTTKLKIIKVGSGDIQINLNWDQPNDLDLHVVPPGMDEIFYSHRQDTAGGKLDLDSNAGCSLDNVNNENIFWPTGKAPNGTYIVRVDYWSKCAVATTTHYRVTMVRFDRVDTFDGTFEPAQADAGGAGDGVEITRFVWP